MRRIRLPVTKLAAFRYPTALLMVTLFFGSGCVKYREQPLSARTEAAKFRSRTLADVASQAGHHGGAWNEEVLVRAALLLHPDMELARAQLRTAQAGIETAAARPNPTLGFNGQVTGNMLAGMAPWSLGFTLDFPIETAGKRTHRIAQATHLSQAAALQYATAAWQVRSRVRKNALDLYSAMARGELLRREQQTQEQTLKALDERVAAGEIARPDLIQSRLLYNQSQLLLRDSERLQAESRAGLADAVGIPARALDGVALDLQDFSRSPGNVAVERLRTRALLSRSDVLEALAEYAASEAALRLEVARQYPDFHFNPGYLWDQGQHKWFIAPTVELPIFDRHHGPIAEAEGKRAQAAAKFRGVQMKASGDLDRAAAGYRGALKKLETAETLLASQEKQKHSAETLLQSGETDRLALLSAAVELDAIALSRLDALIEAQAALGALEDAAQTSVK